MRTSIFTAVFALLLIGSLSACSMTASMPDKYTAGLASTDRTALENNGVHDATAPENAGERRTTLGDPYDQGSPNKSLNSPNGKTLSRDIQTTGEKVISGTENAAKDVTNGLQNAGKNVTNGVREAGQDLEKGTINAERDAKDMIDKKR